MKLNREIGNQSEKLIINYLKKRNYKILDTNFYTKLGEVDIIARDNSLNCICFIEVKSRFSLNFGYPGDALTPSKIKKIINSSKYYILKNKIKDTNFRFDVAEVIYTEPTYNINYIKNAFIT